MSDTEKEVLEIINRLLSPEGFNPTDSLPLDCDLSMLGKIENIAKVQLPLNVTVDPPRALVYNKGRDLEFMVGIGKELKKAMNGKVKAYFYYEIDEEGEVKFGKEAPTQEW